MPAPRLAIALLLWCGLALGQTVDFELQTYPDCPVVFADNARTPAPGVPRRQFVTVRNASRKSVAAVTFQQSVSEGSKTEIVAIEHVDIAMAPGEKKRVSISVEEVRQRSLPGKPVLSAVAVEFLDGTLWNAPTKSAQ